MSQNVLITGGNRGIGLALVKDYLQRGDHVIALCRKASDGLRETDAEVIEAIDVTDSSSLNAVAQRLSGRTIDILINNAGILNSESLGGIAYDDVLKQFEVNAIGPLRVTEALRDNLKKNSKVALITSRMGSVSDNTSGGYYGYRMSKAALNAAGKSLANDLKEHGIAVALLHPGFVQTEMVNNAGDISAETAAERLAQRIDGLTLENSGSFWHSNGEILPW